MRFRPTGGITAPKHDKGAQEARAHAVGEKVGGTEPVYEGKHEHEIERAQNVASGLAPDGAPKSQAQPRGPKQPQQRMLAPMPL